MAEIYLLESCFLCLKKVVAGVQSGIRGLTISPNNHKETAFKYRLV